MNPIRYTPNNLKIRAHALHVCTVNTHHKRDVYTWYTSQSRLVTLSAVSARLVAEMVHVQVIAGSLLVRCKQVGGVYHAQMGGNKMTPKPKPDFEIEPFHISRLGVIGQRCIREDGLIMRLTAIYSDALEFSYDDGIVLVGRYRLNADYIPYIETITDMEIQS